MTRPAAISKSQATGVISDGVEELLTRAIPIINQKLMGFDSAYQTIYLREIGLPERDFELRGKTAKILVKIYSDQGWKVRYESGDQRDPDSYLQFS